MKLCCFVYLLLVQVILVQVNPGETFTIRAEDGSLQCIQGQSLDSLLYYITTLTCGLWAALRCVT